LILEERAELNFELRLRDKDSDLVVSESLLEVFGGVGDWQDFMFKGFWFVTGFKELESSRLGECLCEEIVFSK
jgi:hypothetical protein